MKKTGLTMLFALACSMMPLTAQNYVLTSVAEQGSTYLNATDNVYFGTPAGEQSVEVKTNTNSLLHPMLHGAASRLMRRLLSLP